MADRGCCESLRVRDDECSGAKLWNPSFWEGHGMEKNAADRSS